MDNDGMEKRALIAAVLCLLVLFLYQSFFVKSKKRPPQQPAPVEQVEREEIKEEIKEAPLPPERPIQIPSPEGKAEDVTVETNLFTATFTTAGGRLKDWKLMPYREEVDPNSAPVNLVSNSDDHLLPLNLDFLGPTSRIICNADKKSLILDRYGEEGKLSFSCTIPEFLRIKKEFVFFANQYQAELFVTVENLSESPLKGRLSLEWIGQKDQEKKGRSYGYVGPVAMIGEKVETKKLNKNNGLPDNVRWAGYEDKYFVAALIPRNSPDMGLKVNKLIEEKERVVESITMIHPQAMITPQRSLEQSYSMYFGPKDRKLLESLGVGLGKAIDFGWFNSIAKPLITVLNVFYSFTKNYGLAIIILTVLIKILFYPLTQKSFQSMKEMQKLQPKMMELREKYKDDKEKLNREMMQLYRTEKINPLGGCLPMILQIPVFIALYQGLWNAIELRHTPFIWWIDDLSAPEDIFSIPLFGFNLPFRILPLIMGVTMYLQQKMTPTPTMGSSQQAKMMEWMPIIFTFLFWGFPSGLVLYWLVNNVLTIMQQYFIRKKG
ncbi:MAG: membrane protein insertase YidC [Deltaproteobacteria bacterium]|nr:MAG: membrane protein insertase YidC [Deltaproteobacteria bacterium]